MSQRNNKYFWNYNGINPLKAGLFYNLSRLGGKYLDRYFTTPNFKISDVKIALECTLGQ